MDVLSPTLIHGLFHTYGLWVLFALVMLESTGIPLPGETALVTAALYAGSTHQIGIGWVVLVAALAAIVGDNIGYLIGRSIGVRLVARYGRYVRLDEPRLKVGQYLFLRHGGKIVFFGRFVAFLRAYAALLAGVNRMRWPHFLLMNALGGICLGRAVRRRRLPVRCASEARDRPGRSDPCWSWRSASSSPASSSFDAMRGSWSSAPKQPFRAPGCNHAPDFGTAPTRQLRDRAVPESSRWFVAR